jgi:hypothetical protein
MRKPKLAAIDPNKHSLRAEHVQQLKTLFMLKHHHQQLINGLDGQIAALLNIGYGVDINKENWHLDLEKGLLSRDHSTNSTQQ